MRPLWPPVCPPLFIRLWSHFHRLFSSVYRFFLPQGLHTCHPLARTSPPPHLHSSLALSHLTRPTEMSLPPEVHSSQHVHSCYKSDVCFISSLVSWNSFPLESLIWGPECPPPTIRHCHITIWNFIYIFIYFISFLHQTKSSTSSRTAPIFFMTLYLVLSPTPNNKYLLNEHTSVLFVLLTLIAWQGSHTLSVSCVPLFVMKKTWAFGMRSGSDPNTVCVAWGKLLNLWFPNWKVGKIKYFYSNIMKIKIRSCI